MGGRVDGEEVEAAARRDGTMTTEKALGGHHRHARSVAQHSLSLSSRPSASSAGKAAGAVATIEW